MFVQYGQFVWVLPLEASEPLEIDCRFVLLSTERVQLYRVNVLRDGVNVYQGGSRAESWVPFVYRDRDRFRLGSGLVRGGLAPGNYVVESYLLDRPYPAVSCTFTIPTIDGSNRSSAPLTVK